METLLVIVVWSMLVGLATLGHMIIDKVIG